MFKSNKKLVGYIFLFGLSFIFAFGVIKIKNHFFGDVQNNKIINVDSDKNKKPVEFPEIPVPEGSDAFFAKNAEKHKFSSGVKVFLYNCKKPLAKVKEFYVRELPLLGWSSVPKGSEELKNAIGMECLVFENKDFFCYIEMEPFKGSDGTALVIQLVKSVNKEL